MSAVPPPTHHGPAPGGPGIEPRWTRADKEAVGTARSTGSQLWFTLSLGIVNEVYWPNIDRPQIRDLQFLVTDGEALFIDERRMEAAVEPLGGGILGYRVVTSDPEGRFRIEKQIISDPDHAALVIRTRMVADPRWPQRLRLFVLCAPHLEIGGWGNSGRVTHVRGHRVLTAFKGDTWLALGASRSFARASCGFVGVNDGWQDLATNLHMDWEYDSADDGNIALIGEIDSPENDFTVAMAFSDHAHGALTTLFQALGRPFVELRDRFVSQWTEATADMLPLETSAGDGGKLYRMSRSLLLAHEDKQHPGALIASLSIPWGENKGDNELGGYHLVWTRDLVNSATGLLAAGDTQTPLKALIYLAVTQRPDGGFHQNFWINGVPYWHGLQLDEVAFPILLAGHLARADALGEFDPTGMALAAAGFLIRHGPVTPQERWEEAAGLSPSTLAATIAALIVAAGFAETSGDSITADFLADHADYLSSHIEDWTAATDGSLHPDIKRHYIRIQPVDPADPHPNLDPKVSRLHIVNRPPGTQTDFPANDVVDAGFLELVRYGIRRPGDRLVEDSLVVVDNQLRRETPAGPVWRRYSHDGYGQRPDGGPFLGWGTGRAWPLLTGERGHYELAADRPVTPFLHTMEALAHGVGLLPEQIWDEPDRPDQFLSRGGPTGAVMPLAWAHAEYLKLLRSAHDGAVFDLIPEVAARYRNRLPGKDHQVWMHNWQPASVPAGTTLRIIASDRFRLVWTNDEWAHVRETDSTQTAVDLGYADVKIDAGQRSPIRFTFRHQDGWEGVDYSVTMS